MKLSEQKNNILTIFLFSIIAIIGRIIIAEDEGGYEGGGEFAEGFGGIAWGGGLAANILFVGYKFVYPRIHNYLPEILRLKYVLNLHILLNIILGILAILHGYALRNRAGIVEYLSVFFIIFLIVSGLTLRYVKNKKVKLFSRMLHAQRLLSIILIILIAIHTATIGD